jgi:hypothetical protein
LCGCGKDVDGEDDPLAPCSSARLTSVFIMAVEVRLVVRWGVGGPLPLDVTSGNPLLT